MPDLPYGIQKRVELGRALVQDPQLVFLDEPMTGMSAEEKEDMSRFVLDVHETFGVTMLLIEHDMAVVMSIARAGRRARLRPPHRRRHAGTRCSATTR